MEAKFNYFWGLLGILGLVGYVLENPVYYAFFAFFLLFLIPVYNKATKNDGNNKKSSIDSDYNKYKIGIWIGTAILLVDSFYLMVYKATNDFTAMGLLFGILIYVGSFFAFIGMEKRKR